MLKFFKIVIATFITFCIGVCFDAIMNAVLLLSFTSDTSLDRFCRFCVYIGRFSVGWFFLIEIVFPYIYNSMYGDDK